MIIDCVSDLHGHLPNLEGGDLLIICGDLTSRDTLKQHSDFLSWLHEQEYKKKVLVAGNHDHFLLENPNFYSDTKIDYLLDSGTEFDGLKIWGSPWTPWFCGVNPKCKAFMRNDKLLANKWLKIPSDTNILVTHGPRYGILDKTLDSDYVGSKTLADRILELDLELHVFGHIHEAYGKCHDAYYGDSPFDTDPVPMGALSINCSIMDVDYRPVNQPIRIEL